MESLKFIVSNKFQNTGVCDIDKKWSPETLGFFYDNNLTVLLSVFVLVPWLV